MAHVPASREDLLKELELRVALASLVPTVTIYDAAIPGVQTVTRQPP